MAPPKYTARDSVFIALMAAAGIAIKPLIVPVIRVVAVPLGLPGGSLVGGIYMMWLILGHAFTGKPWAATLVGVVQAILAWVMGVPGPQGPWMLVMYVAPGMAADLVLRLYAGASAAALSPGAAVLAGMEGSRPMLLEIQALVTPTTLGTPRRAVVGWDSQRLSMVLAVLEAHGGVRLGGGGGRFLLVRGAGEGCGQRRRAAERHRCEEQRCGEVRQVCERRMHARCWLSLRLKLSSKPVPLACRQCGSGYSLDTSPWQDASVTQGR